LKISFCLQSVGMSSSNTEIEQNVNRHTVHVCIIWIIREVHYRSHKSVLWNVIKFVELSIQHSPTSTKNEGGKRKIIFRKACFKLCFNPFNVITSLLISCDFFLSYFVMLMLCDDCCLNLGAITFPHSLFFFK
jgi:hypothetical protein